ncbi:hypothetical protein LCGC14_0721180 [marine sediment metagenome]|uniref:Uncharacterized protein n=1 Tax=marine sediment metagenome TaxID=412755 RepID=A0A0F9TJM5_9ZZZZ
MKRKTLFERKPSFVGGIIVGLLIAASLIIVIGAGVLNFSVGADGEIVLIEQAVNNQPDTGYVNIFAKVDGKVYSKDDTGKEYNLTAGAGVTPTSVLLPETTTPAPVADTGQIYTKPDNSLYFQDGAGTEHLVHGNAFSGLWYHDIAATILTISTQGVFTLLVDIFSQIEDEDDLGNAVGDASAGTITIGASGDGVYITRFDTSLTVVGGANKQVMMAVGTVLNTPLDITGATNTDPIVITSTGHGLVDGDMVIISGVTGNTAANGSFIVNTATADTFEAYSLTGASVAGNGAYDADTGNVDVKFSGAHLAHRIVSGSDLDGMGNGADMTLVTSDKIALYAVNLDGTQNLSIAQVTLTTVRVGD